MKSKLIRIASWGLVLVSQAVPQDDSVNSVTLTQAASYFAELKQACATNDPGSGLWGVEVYGPVMLIDAATRNVIANQADEEGLLEKQGDVFVGTYPPDQPLANAPIKWAGVRWVMASSSSPSA